MLITYTCIHKDNSKGHLWRDFFEGHVWILGKNILHYCFVIQHLRCFPLLFMSLLLFFQSEQWQKLLANKLLVIFAITVTPTNTEMLMSILWTKYFNTLMVKLCTQLSKTLKNPKSCRAGSNSEGKSRENFKTARNWWIFIINIKD